MAELSLINGQRIVLDEEDVPKVQGYPWSTDTWGAVVAQKTRNGKHACTRMNRIILGIQPGSTNVLVLHKNGNKQDLRKENLLLKQRDWQKQLPDVMCACGCGRKIRPYGSDGLPNKFVQGHANQKHSTVEEKSASRRKSRLKTTEKYRNKYKNYKRLCMEFLGNTCYFCGLSYDGKNASFFEFDHVNPDHKEVELSKCMYQLSAEKIANEIVKCRLVCANCHNRRHKGDW